MTARKHGTAFWLSGLFALFALSIAGGCGDNETSTGTTATASTATPRASTDTAAEPSKSTAAEQVVVLRHDGLGVVTFGQPVDTVIEVLSGLFGPPDLEEIQISPEVDRTVQWEEPFLYLQFTSRDHFDAVGGPDPVPDGPIFHYYLTTSGEHTTDAGIAQGSTVAQLVAAYPEVVFHQGCGDSVREFLVEAAGGWPRLPIFGLLDGEVENLDTRIVQIGAGWDRNPC